MDGWNIFVLLIIKTKKLNLTAPAFNVIIIVGSIKYLMKMKTGRFHIIIDVEKVDNSILVDESGLKNFLVDLTGKIDMHVLFGPAVVSGIPENPGLSGFVIIDFSHISCHTFTSASEAQVDIFSCKAYDQAKAIQAVLDYFKVPRSSARFQQVCWE